MYKHQQSAQRRERLGNHLLEDTREGTAFGMPGLVRKLLIFAAVDGLILQPTPPRNHGPTTQQAIKIDYKGNVKPLLKDRREEDTAPVALEAHGIIGRPTKR